MQVTALGQPLLLVLIGASAKARLGNGERDFNAARQAPVEHRIPFIDQVDAVVVLDRQGRDFGREQLETRAARAVSRVGSGGSRGSIDAVTIVSRYKPPAVAVDISRATPCCASRCAEKR